MYILRVVYAFGTYRYAYGSENEALKSMQKWLHCPSIVEVNVFKAECERLCELR